MSDVTFWVKLEGRQLRSSGVRQRGACMLREIFLAENVEVRGRGVGASLQGVSRFGRDVRSENAPVSNCRMNSEKTVSSVVRNCQETTLNARVSKLQLSRKINGPSPPVTSPSRGKSTYAYQRQDQPALIKNQIPQSAFTIPQPHEDWVRHMILIIKPDTQAALAPLSFTLSVHHGFLQEKAAYRAAPRF